MSSALGNLWTSAATFRADARGRVVVARSAPLPGSYRGRDAMGLFWSMRPKSCASCVMAPAPVATVRVVASSRDRRLASTSFVRRGEVPGISVKETTLSREGFIGCYSNPGTQPFYPATRTARPGPAILLLGGSEGGLDCDIRSALLASHGYPTLRLAYFRMPGLPQELDDIPLEYFRSALAWLARQPGVDPAKLIVFGISRGGECALLLGSVYADIVHGVVSYVGSSVANPASTAFGQAAWTLAGKPVAAGTEIPVEKSAGPIFLVSGVEDLLWPSSVYAAQIADRLKAHQRSDYTSLVYERAGHLVGTAVPNLPLFDPSFGGTEAGDARGRADSWPKLLVFLARLKSS